jgi:hypothetical protein
MAGLGVSTASVAGISIFVAATAQSGGLFALPALVIAVPFLVPAATRLFCHCGPCGRARPCPESVGACSLGFIAPKEVWSCCKAEVKEKNKGCQKVCEGCTGCVCEVLWGNPKGCVSIVAEATDEQKDPKRDPKRARLPIMLGHKHQRLTREEIDERKQAVEKNKGSCCCGIFVTS